MEKNLQNTFNNNNNNNNNNNMLNNDNYCSNCGNYGHLFKQCCDPVNSYGLLCFYKKKIMVKDTKPEFNKLSRTKKNSLNNKSKSNNKYNNINNQNINNIRILKRHETVSHTLKNMIGIVGYNPCERKNNVSDCIEDTNNSHESIDGIIDIANNEIIDMDNEFNTTIKLTDTQNPTQPQNPTQTLTITVLNNKNIEPEIPMKEITTQKVVLVQRSNTIGLIEFIRGKYDVNNSEYIIKLFNMMTFDEKRMFREYDSFDMLITIIGLKREFNNRGKFSDAKTKYNTLRDDPRGNQINALLDKSYTKWSSPEWGAPKGRRSNKEYDIDCAIREFVEETGIKYKNINVYRNIKALEEVYKGINGVVYKHTYFIADIKDNSESHENINYIEKGGYLSSEVSNVKCFNLTECQKIIRPYYLSKLNAIKKGFQIIHCMNNYFE